MNPIRILVDSLADKGLPNSQMSNAREIVRRLDPERFHVTMFRMGEPDLEIEARRNTRLIRLGRHGRTFRILNEFMVGEHRILFYLKSSPAARWYLQLRKFRPDGRIVVGTVESRSDLRREPTIAPEAVRLWERTVLRSDVLFSNSSAVQRNLKVEYDLDSAVVPTGVDTKFFTPMPGRQSNVRPRVLFVGSLRPFKQPQVLIDAAKRSPHADFVLVGDGPMAAELRQQITQGELSNVVLLGGLNSAELQRQYQQSDIFLFPSSWEGSPKVILEAAACGLPVIARRDYEPETVIHGETGYLVASDDELFLHLEKLLTNSELCRRLGVRGREHSKKFDWDAITRKWEEIFSGLISQKGGAV